MISDQNGSSSGICIAPLNPAFVEYQQELMGEQNSVQVISNNLTFSSITLPVSSTNDTPSETLDHPTGLIPSPVDLSHLSPVSVDDLVADSTIRISDLQLMSSSYPSTYDLRDVNGVTAVRDQGQTGSCWTFGTFGSLESYLLHNKSESWDFSENNMKNTLLESYENGFDLSSPDEGGNNLRSLAYLARWDGPVMESDDPYSDSSTVSPSDTVVSKHVQEAFIFPYVNYSSDICKLMIRDYGAISIAIYFDESGFFNEENNTYYCYEENVGIDHAVTLVGWDDNYDRNNFTPAAPGNGAYIVKNSWGDNWGEDGYFYASYYDTSIGTTYNSTEKTYNINYLFTAENVSNYDRIYQYDPLGWCSTLGNNSNTGTGANIFTADSNETLEAVSFYTVDSNSFYNISIYLDPDNGPINTSGPASVKNGSMAVAGYHTVDLDNNVSLSAGQNFSVVVEFTTPDYNYPIAIEMPISDYSSHACAEAGQSYVKFSGSEWEDVSASGANICIKAFTTEEKEPQTAFVAGTKYIHVNEEVDFHDVSLFSPDTWQWDFGDNSTSSVQNPLHSYSDTGVYNVSLNATNTFGNNISTRTSFIHVLNSTIVVNSSGSADFSTIREAVVAASDGDVIVIEPGTYNENLYLETDNISLISSTGNPEDVRIVSQNSDDIVIYVGADNITVSGISAEDGDIGIAVKLSSGCIVSNCSTSGNTCGIYLYVSQDNSVLNCTSYENLYGLRLRVSVNNVLNDNSMNYNTFNSYFDSNANIVGTNNLVDGKPIYYLVNSSDQVIDASSNAGLVYLINCSNITVEDTVIENNYLGFYLLDSSNVTISNSTSSGNYYGVYLSSSNDNTISGCNITGMTSYGLLLKETNSNLIYNNYFNNSNNVYVTGGGFNEWNTTRTTGTNIINGSFLGGNFWATPAGTGWSQTEYSVGNGFCAAYEITDDGNNTDYLPLTLNSVQPTVSDEISSNDDDGIRVKIATPTSSTSDIVATDSSVRFVGKDAKVEYVFTDGSTPVNEISFESEINEGYIMASVSLLDKLPENSPAPSSATVYQGMEIILGDEEFSSGIGNAKISFSVSKEWLESNGFDESDILMEHFSEDVWNILPTVVTGEDEDNFYFEATTDGFSPFIICVDDENEVVGSEVQNENVPAESDYSSGDVDLDSEVTDGNNGNTVVFALLFIVLAGIIGVVYWSKTSGENS